MGLRTSLGFWNATFFASLGLSPVAACSNRSPSDVDGNGGRQQTPASAEDADSGSGGNAGASMLAGSGARIGDVGAGGTGSGGATLMGSGGATLMGSGGATLVGSGGTVSTGSGGALSYRACTSSSNEGGTATGFVQCSQGPTHRVAVVECASALPRAEACAISKNDTAYGDCASDADCTATPNGYCSRTNSATPCTCKHGCRTDADCGSEQICLCGNPVGTCVQASCKQDSDCAEGALCLSYHGCSGVAFACQTTEDACLRDADCGAGVGCIVLGQSRECSTTCVGAGGSGGRPFLVFDEARTARVVARADFSSDLSPRTSKLSQGERGVLGARYLEIALMEHASIAAFARFALELLSLGAPCSLVERANAAMADEVRHARDAFALAGAYLGHPVGPGPLETADALSGRSPREIVRTAVLEGCIGETVAAVEAAEALAHARDEAVRGALAKVVEDETRHAELSWRFVQWVLEDGPADLAEWAALELTTIVDGATAAGNAHAAAATDASPALRAHGYVGESVRAEIRRSVLREVVAPCAQALASSTGRSRVRNALRSSEHPEYTT